MMFSQYLWSCSETSLLPKPTLSGIWKGQPVQSVETHLALYSDSKNSQNNTYSSYVVWKGSVNDWIVAQQWYESPPKVETFE